MSLVLPPLYHWSLSDNRESIRRHGLKPTCPTATTVGPPIVGTTSVRHVDHEATKKAVCLGTTPSHAWHLSGNLFGDNGTEWDLWQVVLGEDDEVYPLSFQGYRLSEIRVVNRIPKSQVWYVGSRTV